MAYLLTSQLFIGALKEQKLTRNRTDIVTSRQDCWNGWLLACVAVLCGLWFLLSAFETGFAMGKIHRFASTALPVILSVFKSTFNPDWLIVQVNHRMVSEKGFRIEFLFEFYQCFSLKLACMSLMHQQPIQSSPAIFYLWIYP